MTAIRFIKQPSERSGGSDYEVGQVVELSAASAARWLRRGVAVEVTDSSAAPEKAVTPKPADAAMEKPVRRTVKPKAVSDDA